MAQAVEGTVQAAVLQAFMPVSASVVTASIITLVELACLASDTNDENKRAKLLRRFKGRNLKR